MISQEEIFGATDEDVPSLTPNQLQEFYGSTSYHEEDNGGSAAGLAEQNVDPHQADELDSEHDMEGLAQPEVILDDAIDGAPLRQSQRTSRPPLRMTYDTLGQPSFHPCNTAGIQGIIAVCMATVYSAIYSTMDVTIYPAALQLLCLPSCTSPTVALCALVLLIAPWKGTIELICICWSHVHFEITLSN